MKKKFALELTESEAEMIAFLLHTATDQFYASKVLRDRTKVSLKDLRTAETVRRKLTHAR
ncbi:hypothetical protein [Larkinella rosea]|uniref:Uncharacterized protein n=1 Tax=Larkinella rosea TaxID=2025312 RepID=A0A3P1C0E7_9BACT|nr:hypothetical protein [Larkinella rosea]RRB06742.1 hypothetical protein EHT25_02800 [Larkinella rosea]